MDGKPKISGRDTYVLDGDELDQLDDLSLTSVIGEATDFLAQPDQELGDDSPEFETGDSTVDALLEDRNWGTDGLRVLHGHTDSQDDSVGRSETMEPPDDLIAPALRSVR
jgi:hypothetical protein